MGDVNSERGEGGEKEREWGENRLEVVKNEEWHERERE